ncbi:MAG TPA: matrixin family metalloprotease, partial [Candidatus Gastranaerophilaceae bacterium]|nr:matrixin family metalloprotease [Candidatus Gastranaerophilaceae bacterium]
IMRWADNLMPLKFYIAPFRFYSKKLEDYKYRQLVMQALDVWQKASGGKVSFVIVDTLMQSQINLDWKRVDRQAFGHCYFHFDGQNRLYSAEVQIGITDGLIHQDYMPETEVYHTILHEIGHALGLGHSPNEKDIMYTPHKYGIVNLSKGDKLTLQWLYKFKLNAEVSEIASKHGIPSPNLDKIVATILENNPQSEFEKVKNSISQEKRDLLEEQEKIADLKKYNIALQNIKISEDIRKIFIPPIQKN